jgi:hypothetical protein
MDHVCGKPMGENTASGDHIRISGALAGIGSGISVYLAVAISLLMLDGSL